jgi:PAP2 superfamily
VTSKCHGPASGLLLVFLLFSPAARTQTDSLEHSSLRARLLDDAATVLDAAGHTLSGPDRWKSGDVLKAGGVVAITAGAALLDQEVKDLVHRNRSPFGDRLTDVSVHYGEGIPLIVVMAGMYGAGLAFESNWLRETAIMAAAAVGTSAVLSTAGKFLVGRARPYAGRGNHEFRPFSGSDEFHSFPSGHTVAAFAFSAVLAERIKNPWATIGFTTAAAACAFSRIYEDEHWLSDVIFSAALSTAVASSVVRWFDQRPGFPDDTGVRLIPTGGGVMIVWRI